MVGAMKLVARLRRFRLPASAICALAALAAGAQAPPSPPPQKPAAPEPTMSFEEYEPKSTLVVPEHPVTRAKYPFVDVHNHQDGGMPQAQLDKLVADMDGLNLQVMVNLSGGVGEVLHKTVDNMKGHYPKRFLVFANVDFSKIDEPDFGKKAAAQLAADVKYGATGLK